LILTEVVNKVSSITRSYAYAATFGFVMVIDGSLSTLFEVSNKSNFKIGHSDILFEVKYYVYPGLMSRFEAWPVVATLSRTKFGGVFAPNDVEP